MTELLGGQDRDHLPWRRDRGRADGGGDDLGYEPRCAPRLAGVAEVVAGMTARRGWSTDRESHRHTVTRGTKLVGDRGRGGVPGRRRMEPPRPGTVQLLPKGNPHMVRVQQGTARLVMVTIGPLYDCFRSAMVGWLR